MITITRYNPELKDTWDAFNENSKNHLFMFNRNYMDYHRERFCDHSLLFYSDDKLIALLPMNEKNNALISHGGLTFGGFIIDEKMKQHTMNDCFNELILYAKNNNFKSLTYKCIPHIYHNQASEEDRFSLFANCGSLKTIDVSTYLNLKNPLKMPKGRKAQISRAKRENVIVEELTELDDYEMFIDLENAVLEKRHNAIAVHTGRELKMLHDFFPNNIHLFVAKKDGVIIAGAVIYEYESVIHTQYMAANELAREIGALDLTISYIIEKYKDTKKWLDFGISTEHNRLFLNEGLVSQKESFGGRTGVYEIWELDFAK